MPIHMEVGPNSKIYVLFQTSQFSLSAVEQAANGTFEERVVLLLPAAGRYFLIVGDEELIVVGMYMQIGIFKKNGTTLSLHQTLMEGNDIRGLALSGDQQELVSCHHGLNFYRQNGSQFELRQTISLAFECFEVNFLGDLVEVHGFSPEIRFYEFNGSAYVPEFTIQTDESHILELNILDNGSKFIFGGESEKVSIYALTNDSFSLLEQLQAGVPLFQIFVDSE